MKYIEFLDYAGENRLDVFTLRDLENLFPETKPKTIKNNLTRWVKKNWVTRLKRNLYINTKAAGDIPEFYIANRLHQPSYVSLEAALSFYNIIPGETAQATSITTKPTRTYKNKYGVFTYRNCTKKAYTGYRLLDIQGYKTLVGSREKSLLDFIHYRLHDGQKNFQEERFNKKQLKKLDKNKIKKYGETYNPKTLEKTLQVL